MKTTEQIKKQLKENKDKIIDLVNENIDLEYDLMLSFAESFSTEIKTIGRGKKKRTYTLKKMHYSETFTDEGTEEDFTLNRSHIIEVDGKKSDGWNIISHFKKDGEYKFVRNK